MAVINELEDQLDRYEEIRATLERQLDEAREQDQSAQQRVRDLEQQVVTLQAQVVALELARQNIPVTIVERSGRLGGAALDLAGSTPESAQARQTAGPLAKAVASAGPLRAR